MSIKLGDLGVTSANWLTGPYNRLGFIRVGELASTAAISRGEGPVLDLPRRERDFSTFTFSFDGDRVSFPEMLEKTYTDGLLLIHDGSILLEHYAPMMTPSDTHLLMSVSKSLTACLCGLFVDRGLLATEDQVVDHLEELRGTSWEGCTVQHLLDMRAGTRWDYAVDEDTIFDISDYRTHSRLDLPKDTASWIRSIANSHDHGGPFRYVSLVTDVLGWILERVGGGRFDEIFSREIWSAIGAEHDAEIMLDASGFSIVEGGVCTTLRDLGRFGQMCLNDGKILGRQVIPSAWLGRLGVRDQNLIDAFEDSPEYDPAKPHAFYHDKWWIFDAERGIYSGLGINGQMLLIHRPSNSVVVKFSTHPEYENPELFALQEAGVTALCESLV